MVIFYILAVSFLFTIPWLIIGILIRLLLRKSVKKLIIATALCFRLTIDCIIIGGLTAPDTEIEQGYVAIEEVVFTYI